MYTESHYVELGEAHLDDILVFWDPECVSINRLIEVADGNFVCHQGPESLSQPHDVTRLLNTYRLVQPVIRSAFESYRVS